CTALDGNLTIVPFEGADLGSLHALESVAGWLETSSADIVDGAEIARIDALKQAGWLNLDGLESLRQVGSLHLDGVSSETFEALSGLRAVTDGTLMLSHIARARDLSGLENVEGIDEFHVNGGAELVSTAAVQLSPVMTNLFYRGSKLTELGTGVTSVLGELDIWGTAVENLDAFADLTSVAGILFIADNPALTDVEGLNALEVAGVLNVSRNATLARLPAFESLDRLGGLQVIGNAALVEVPAYSLYDDLSFDAITFGAPEGEVERQRLLMRPDLIEVLDNPVLQQFDVPSGWRAGSQVAIRNNAALTRLGLGQLQSIDHLEISGNAALASVDLPAVETVDVLRVQDNPLLSEATFDSVQSFDREMSGNASAP
ncbi:MAG TPA: hypothetical protein VNN80_18450, partial [Polyangiaceae bacterium]|nr:hypothetical protein [Polyangiaceae bacterium]